MENIPTQLVQNLTDTLSHLKIASSIWSTMPQDISSKITGIINIGKIVLILAIIYFIILIISKLLKLRDSFSLNTIKNNVIEINKKLDNLIPKKKQKKA